MKTIIAGGRHYLPQEGDYAMLDRLRKLGPITMVISGGCTGADKFGEVWAASRGIPVVVKSPKDMDPAIPFWKRCHMRNQEMADIADALIAFPGGRGTADMVRRAKTKGLIVYEVDSKTLSGLR